MILIVTNKQDVHPTPVIEYLNERAYPVFRLNTEALLTDYQFYWWANEKGTDFYIKNVKNLSEAQQKEKEGELILKSTQPGDYLVLLDEKGKQFTSMQFASYLEKKTHTVPKRLVFVIGGPYGFSEAVYKAATEKISLSMMTFSHQMVRLIFVEQIYRAMTILNNEPYHHE